MSPYRNVAVTNIPVVVTVPEVRLEEVTEEARWEWMSSTMDMGILDLDYVPLPPDAAASVLALDKRALRKLEREFEVKLSSEQIADILGFAKLVDAVRLGGDRKSRELALIYLEKAHGLARRKIVEELYPDQGYWCDRSMNSLCVYARLGIIYPP